MALVLLLVCAFLMALLQLFPDSIPTYPPQCQTLYDLGFHIIPHLSDAMGLLADVLVLLVIVSFLILTPFVLETPQLVVRRWLILLATLYLFRGIVLVATRYPRLPYKTEIYQPSNPLLGALLIVVGAKSTATDIMYSGHTVNFVLAASFVSRYTRYGLFSMLFWLASIGGIIALVATREHYTADIIVAFIITKLSFWCYHLFFDSLYRRFWETGIEITDTGPGYLAMPLTLQDKFGQVVEIAPAMVSKRQLEHGFDENTGKSVTMVNLGPTDPMRREVKSWLSWFDGE